MKEPSSHQTKKLLLIAFFSVLLQTTVTSVVLNGLQPSVEALPQTDTIMAPGTEMAVDPHTSTANSGEYFTVYVNITDVDDLISWAFRLRWPTALLEFVSATEVTTFFNGDFTYKAGLNYVGVGSSILTGPAVSGSGTLCSIRLQVRERTGNCTLELDDTELYDDDIDPIVHTASDGYFYTTYPVAEFAYVPDPSKADEYYGRPIAGETVTFNATDSYDPDQAYKEQVGRGIVSYEWSFGDGDTDTGMIVEHEYTEAGQYEAKLTVTDDDGETDEEIYPAGGMHIFLHDIAVINVIVTNDPPEVMPGQNVYINATVLNNGTDTERLNVTAYLGPYSLKTMLFHYVEIMPPPSPPHDYYSLEADLNATTTIICDTTGVPGGRYTVNVTAFLVQDVDDAWVLPSYPLEQDLDDNTFTDGEVTITFHDIAVTNVTAFPSQVTVGDPVSINVTVTNEGTGEESFDVTTYYDETEIDTETVTDLGSEANKTLEFEWDTTSIPKGTYTISANASVVVNETDTADNTFEDSEVTVRLPGDPVASFTYAPEEPLVNQEVAFDASSSTPDGGTIISYEWDFGDETIEIYVGANLTDISNHTYTEGGPYTVTLNVTDSEGKWATTSKSITVYALPVADFTYSPSEPVVDAPVTFNASASYDPDGGTIVSYDWDFDDEATGTGNITTHTYTEFGEYNVTLTIIDDEDVANSTWKLVTVYALPVADFTYSPSEPVVDAPVTFNASASYDPDGGTIVSYDWDFDDEATGTGNVTTHTYTETGTYTVTLSVTDNDGLIGTTTVDVTVSTQSLVHDVAVTSVTPNPTVVAPGQYVSVTVVVENQGGYAETFNVTAYYDTDTIGTKTSTLESTATESIVFTWNTAVVAEDTYTLSAEADVVSGETDVEDNTYIDDTVTVVRQAGPGQTLAIEFSGEREYFEGDDVKIRLAALVRYADTMMPASNANVTIRIFDSEGELWGSGVMVEKLTGTGIYEWESIDTIAQLELEKGFYLIHVQARLGGLEASTISQFRITTAEKTSSIISIDVNPTSATTGSSITLSGAISPKRPRVTVTIQYRLSGGTWSELRTVKTSQTGYYSVSWVVTTAGTYEVKASWPGDTRTEGTESEVKTVTVQEGSSLHLEIPPYVTVAIAAIVGSIVGSIIGAAVLMRARKPKPL